MLAELVTVTVPFDHHFHLHLHLHVPRGVGAFLPGTVLAIAAAVLCAFGSVLQQEVASSVADAAGQLRFRELVGRREWIAGQAGTVVGSGLQVLALALAPVSIVQPLIAGGLVAALALRSARARTWPTATESAGAGLTAGGLAIFVLAARPAAGVTDRIPSTLSVLAVVGLCAVLFLACVRAGSGLSGALAYGVSSGVSAGVAAVLISAALRVLSKHGVVAVLSGAQLWAAIVLAVAAQFGAQQAYSRGALTWSLPAVTLFDPLAAVPAARFLLGERLEPGHAAVWLPAGVIAAAGVLLLATTGRGPAGRPPVGPTAS